MNFFGLIVSVLTTAFLMTFPATQGKAAAVTIPDTGQSKCYNNTREVSFCPDKGSSFFGQDAQIIGPAMAYRDNLDGTVTDLVTGLTWSKAVDAKKVSLDEAFEMAEHLTLGGHSDWRVPNIKELYSLINFTGTTGFAGPPRRGQQNSRDLNAIPYINTDFFDFKYGNVRGGERYIDAQWLSSKRYVSTTMDGAATLFGVNFADGRIKGYGYSHRRGNRGEKKFYVRFVRGSAYGQNQFSENGNGTVTDQATGLTYAKADSGRTMTWEEALKYARASHLGGYSDWRLPNAKELQYIVDYTRSPATTNSPALDPIFSATPVTNEAGQKDFGHYWTSTTHKDGPRPESAVTVCFGRAMGMMHGKIMDVHGAGAQRSDPKSGGNSIGHGPQGDARHGSNFVRLVRGGKVTIGKVSSEKNLSAYPNVIRVDKGFEASMPAGSNLNLDGQNAGGPAGAPRAMRNNGRFANQGMPGRPLGGKAFITRLDRNGDGRVDPSEFDGPPAHFSHFDQNLDGYITEDEAPTGPPQ